uniref:G_PROTEIN_RECEP_F1_2 domain-containing protein n=1 Tax=Haemonchus contortus TaxID=6289 RepID=A0A7I4Y064_HAECO|nr:7TM GPCR domain containing protein [Haemonchus contortus]
MDHGGDRADEILAGVIMLAVSAFGNVVNIAVVVLLFRTPSFHNAFGLICASHLIADIGVLLIFSFWAAPAALFGFPDTITQTHFGGSMGQLAILFWYASTYGHIQVAVNRLLAIKYPLLYKRVFSIRNTKIILAVFWAISAANVFAYFWRECDFKFNVHALTWFYAPTYCGYIIAFYMTLVHESALCAIVIAIDTIAFFAIYAEAKKPSKSFDEAKMLKQNTNLYVQGCVQTVTFALAVLSFFVFSKFAKNKWGTFASTTCVWEVAHAVDGLILIAFHKKFRMAFGLRTLLCRKEIKSETTGIHPSTTSARVVWVKQGASPARVN